MKSTIMALMLMTLIMACQTNSNPTNPIETMDKDQILKQVMDAEAQVLSALREGDMSLNVHLNSPDYRNISNGEILTYETHKARAESWAELGIKSYDFEVQNRDFNIINEANVIETMSGKATLKKADGSSLPPNFTVFTFLWQYVDGTWKFGYLHSSSPPKGK